MHHWSHSIPCMDVQTDAVKPHWPFPWTIGSMQCAIANAIFHTLTFISITLWHAFLWITSVHSSQVTLLAAFTSAPFWRRISTTLLHPSCADTCTKEVKPSWGVQHGQQTNAAQYPFLAHFFIFKKTQTQYSLRNSIAHLPGCSRKHALSIGRTHWCTNVPKDDNLHGVFGKSNDLNDILCFQRKFKCIPYSNSATKLPIEPSELIKKHAHKCPILVQAISMRKCFNHKPLLGGAHILTSAQKKHANLRASLITFYPICIWMCKLMPWNFINLIHRQLAQCSVPLPMPFPTLWSLFLPPSVMHFSESRLSIHHKLPYRQHSLQHHSEGESLPPLCTLLVLICAKEWRHPEESNMVSKCKCRKDMMVVKQMLDNIYLLPFFTFTKMQTQHWLCQSITHLLICSRKHTLSIGTTYWCTNVPKAANHMACLEKAMLWMTFFAFKENSIAVHTQTQQ